jgi:hypothetical protein
VPVLLTFLFRYEAKCESSHFPPSRTKTTKFNLINSLKFVFGSKRNVKRSHFPPFRTETNRNGAPFSWSRKTNKNFDGGYKSFIWASVYQRVLTHNILNGKKYFRKNQKEVFKGTQEFFWLRFWLLYYFIVSYAQIIRFCTIFFIKPLLGHSIPSKQHILSNWTLPRT